ncbi:hypothetical protein H5410_037481 [Solanum commersonii]|uniref:Uncharacterized protein n=1 Tax=Solanum commersonii TaxID=4109 RepID=A0A9J5Y7A0_SOLCO|nr:hypothetical protein H5410_037481 [Solanum commersonii]
MLLQTTYQDKTTQTEKENTIEDILKVITTLCVKVDSMDNEIQKLKSKASTSQQHDYKNSELRRSKDEKIPEIEGDVGKLPKTHNICSITTADTSRQVSERQHKNINLNKLFEKPFTPKISKSLLVTEPQTSTYADSLHHDKKTYNHITRTYIENIYEIQTYLNLNPRSTITKEPNQDYLVQKLQGYNNSIAQPKTNANLVKACYNYGLLNTVYTYDGEEISGMSELHKAFITYKRVTKGNLFYIKFYTAPAEILYEEIKTPIQVVKIGLTKDMIKAEDIRQQLEIQKIEIPSFYANKRIIGISTIIQEELKKADMDEVQIWILSLFKPEERPTTRALKTGFISAELLTRYCKLIGHKYPYNISSKCNEEYNVIPDVQLE